MPRPHHRTSNARSQRRTTANTIVNSIIPALLHANQRAAAGIASTTLHITPPATSNADSTSPAITIAGTDTFASAAYLHTLHPTAKIAVLNMASQWVPGGGFRSGSLAQEESLCARSTLFAALPKGNYPLPDVGAEYTRDVLVFQSPDGKAQEQWVDVISAAAVCRPKVIDAAYRTLLRDKMRLVMGVLVAECVEVVVLGAWGCGAYSNPIEEVVVAWREVLADGWEGVRVVEFAVLERKMAVKFCGVWGVGMEWRDVDAEVEAEG